MSQLAILGGKPVVSSAWPETNEIGREERTAVLDVMDSGVLSGFRATAGEDFHGGPRVRALEAAWAKHYGVRHAVAFNSLTSGLFASIGAVGIQPGDEVIVSPYTMAASATCALVYGGVPVFADIDPNTYCMDPASVEERITPRTKAIVPVHLFGGPAAMDELLDIAERHDLRVIEDCAQAPGGRYKGQFVGTFGDIGGFSLNYHKAIHSGEGGIMVTDDDDLALRLKLIRNHGEVVAAEMGIANLVNVFGGNTRMTELEAAVAFEQLKKLERLTEHRVRLAASLDRRLSGFDGITPTRLHEGSRHVYYFYPMRYDADACGLPREVFVRAVQAEGVPLREAYVRPIYWEPMFQKRTAFGRGFPWTPPFHDGNVSYAKGECPVAEEAHERTLIFGKFCRTPLTEAHMGQVEEAFSKVLTHVDEIQSKIK